MVPTLLGALASELRQLPALIRETVIDDPVSRRFAVALLATNAIGLLIYMAVKRAAAMQMLRFPTWLDIGRDGSALEILNYVQTGLAAIFLIAASLSSRRALYFAWGLFFLFILADDSLQYHETVGRMLVATFALPAAPGTRPQDTGELIAWAAAAIVLLPGIAVCHWFSPPQVRRHGVVLLLCLAALVMAAVVFDMVHMVFSRTAGMGGVTGLLEDGGELIAIACACAYAFGLMRQHRRSAVTQSPARYPLPARSGLSARR